MLKLFIEKPLLIGAAFFVYRKETLKNKPFEQVLYNCLEEIQGIFIGKVSTSPAGNCDVDIDNENTLNYHYDQIGNLTKDSSAGLDSIYWTVYGKIWKIVKFDGDTIKFHYGPDGNRIAKEVFVDSLHRWTNTYYVHDAQGNIMATYQWINRDTFSLDELVMYGSSRLGTLSAGVVLSDTALRDSAYYADHDTSTNPCTDSVTYFTAGLKQYEFTNHLGNVLLTLTDRHIPVYIFGGFIGYLPEVASAQDYYPFGMEMVGRAYNPALYRFGFNGKENVNEVEGIGDQIDFGSRIYDTRLGRWLSIDPLQKKYPAESHYDFAMNSPILLKDLGGKEVFAYNAASQDIVLGAVKYLFGKDNGFAFENNKLIHTGAEPQKMSDSQKLLYKYFTETILSSKIPVTVHAHEDVLLADDGKVEKVTPGGARTVETYSKNQFSKVDNGPGMLSTYKLDKLETVTEDVLLPDKIMKDGISVQTENGSETFSAEYSLVHEFAHAIVNFIMKEFKGQFNGVDFTKMTETQRADWAIRYTNTLLKGKILSSQENGAGQHGRAKDVKPAPADVAPLTK